MRRLQAQGHVPILAEEVVAGSPERIGLRRWRRGVRRADVGDFTFELVALLRSGLALDRALDKLARLSRNAVFGEVVADLQAQVRRGTDLSAAMEPHPRIFSRMYRTMATQVVVQVGEVVHDWWWAMAGILAAGLILLRRLLQNPVARAAWDRRILAVPLAGEVVGKYEAAKFTRTLGTLMQGGVPLLDAIDLARQVVGNRVMDLGLRRVAAGVRQGQGFAGPLLDAAVFPGTAADLLQVGEETGDLETMLLRVAEIYDRDVQTKIKRTVDILGPLLILVLAALIGAIIMSVLVALLGVNELAF